MVNSCFSDGLGRPVFSSFFSHSFPGSGVFHSSSILILSASLSYLMTFFSSRNSENSLSLLEETSRVVDSSFMLCHAPSLRIAKNLSIINSCLYFYSVCSYFNMVEHLVV
jgi:hypothetical protein